MKVTVRASEAPLATPPTSTLHSLRSVGLSGSQASLSLLFAAADVTIIRVGSSADVDNEPRETAGGVGGGIRDSANFQILPRNVY